MERRRNWRKFGLATGVGVVGTLGLLLLGDLLVGWLWPGLDAARDAWPYLLVGIEGLLVGALMASLVSYYPSMEGFLASLTVPIYLALGRLMPEGAVLSIDMVVELALKFEAHFAGLYLAAFILFMSRGGGMTYPRFIGLRYLRFKMITGITVVGVALGVAGLMVVLSVMSGFEGDLKGKIVGTNAHAVIQKKALPFTEYREVLEKLKGMDGVVAATPFVYNEVMVSSEFNLTGVFIRGIDVDTATTVSKLDVREGSLAMLTEPALIDAHLESVLLRSLPRPRPKPAAEGRPATAPGEGDEPKLVEHLEDPDEVPMPTPISTRWRATKNPGVLIGAELKKILKVKLGDKINVVSPLSEELGPTGPMPKARSFRVAGVFYTGMYEYDAKSIYVTLGAAQKFFDMDGAVSGIALKFDELDRAKTLCKGIVSSLGGFPFSTRTWFEMNKSLFSALKMEKVAMFLVLVIVIIVSAFGIVSTLVMLVWEKVKEIAILKSMGATGDGVMKIFMVEGITIGLVGTLLGVLVGGALCMVLSATGVQLDPEVYYLEALPVKIDPVEFSLIAGIALHISFIATIYPSRRASRLRPVEGLRYD